MVLTKVDELEDIGVPGFEVDGESARTLVAALIHISRSCIVDTEHGNNAVRVAVGARNVRTVFPVSVDALNGTG